MAIHLRWFDQRMPLWTRTVRESGPAAKNLQFSSPHIPLGKGYSEEYTPRKRCQYLPPPLLEVGSCTGGLDPPRIVVVGGRPACTDNPRYSVGTAPALPMAQPFGLNTSSSYHNDRQMQSKWNLPPSEDR